MHNRQKRKSTDPVDEDEEGDASTNLFSSMNLEVNYRVKNIPVSTKELSNFSRLSEEAQNNCIKAVSRLFILKGNHSSISRATVTETLGKVDDTFKKHSSAVLSIVQTQLQDMLGYHVVSAADIKGLQGSAAKGDVFYLTSALAQQSPALSAVLHRGGKDPERCAFHPSNFLSLTAMMYDVTQQQLLLWLKPLFVHGAVDFRRAPQFRFDSMCSSGLNSYAILSSPVCSRGAVAAGAEGGPEAA